MTTHILSMTYGPKIAGIRDGTIRQTIRRYNPERPFKIGDKLLIHGWSGMPYRSPWNWRIQGTIRELDLLTVSRSLWILHKHIDLMREGYCTAAGYWEDRHDALDEIALDDGISPPTSYALKTILEHYHGELGHHFVKFQVIRW